MNVLETHTFRILGKASYKGTVGIRLEFVDHKGKNVQILVIVASNRKECQLCVNAGRYSTVRLEHFLTLMFVSRLRRIK